MQIGLSDQNWSGAVHLDTVLYFGAISFEDIWVI